MCTFYAIILYFFHPKYYIKYFFLFHSPTAFVCAQCMLGVRCVCVCLTHTHNCSHTRYGSRIIYSSLNNRTKYAYQQPPAVAYLLMCMLLSLTVMCSASIRLLSVAALLVPVALVEASADEVSTAAAAVDLGPGLLKH